MKKSNSDLVKAPTDSQTPLPQSMQEPEQYNASFPNPIRRNDGPPTAGRTPSRALIGRTAADTSDGKRAFSNAKSSIGIGTWNVSTLNQEGNLEHLLHELKATKPYYKNFLQAEEDCKGVDVGVPWWHHKEQTRLHPD